EAGVNDFFSIITPVITQQRQQNISCLIGESKCFHLSDLPWLELLRSLETMGPLWLRMLNEPLRFPAKCLRAGDNSVDKVGKALGGHNFRWIKNCCWYYFALGMAATASLSARSFSGWPAWPRIQWNSISCSEINSSRRCQRS